MASPIEGQPLVWYEQVDLELGQPQAEDYILSFKCVAVGEEQSNTKSKKYKCPVEGCAKHVRTARFHVIKQHMPALVWMF